jgi:hypothetical protein
MDFVGIGDLHLTDDTGKGGLAAYIKDHDAMVGREVEKVKAYARQHHISTIVQYGDVCEGPRMSYSAMLSFLEMTDGDDLSWVFILGNHDKFAEDSAAGHSLQVIQRMRLPNVRIITQPKLIKHGKTKLNMLPWPHSEFSREYLNVAHVDVEGAVGDNGRASKTTIKHAGKSVIGHIHTNQVVKGAHFSGTLYQTNFGENSAKFFHHVRNDSGWDIESVGCDPEYTLTSLEVSSKRDLRQIDDSPNHLYKLKLLNAKAISAADYGANVVRVSPASSGRDEEIDLGDLKVGAEVTFDPDEFFEAWIERQTVTPELRKSAIQLRKEMLHVR